MVFLGEHLSLFLSGLDGNKQGLLCIAILVLNIIRVISFYLLFKLWRC
jgi:hypothetical protein